MLAFSRKQILHKPNLRYTDRGRPQNLHRFSFRELNLGDRFAFAILDLLATEDFPGFHGHQLSLHQSIDNSLELGCLSLLFILFERHPEHF